MRKSIVVTMGLGLLFGACQDSTGPEGDQLSRAESLQLAAQVLASSEGAATGSMTMAGGSSAGLETAGPPTSFSFTQETTHPCPTSGNIGVALELSGMFDEDTNSLQADLSGSQVHNGCAFPHNGLTLTVNGEPSIAFTASIGAVEGVPSQPFTFTLDGGIRWASSDGRAGVCAMQLDAVTDFSAQQRTLQGSVCGHTIDQTLTWN